MKKNSTVKKLSAPLIIAIFLLSGAGVLIAQFQAYAVEIRTVILEKDTTATLDESTVLQDDTSTTESYVKESVLNEPSTLDAPIIDKQEDILSEPKIPIVEEQPLIRADINIKNDYIQATEEERIGIQAEYLLRLRILKENDAARLESIRRERLRRANIFAEEKAASEREARESATGEERIGDELGVEVDGIEEIFEDIAAVEEETKKEVRNLERVVLEKKQKIIDRVRIKRARTEASKDSDKDGISDYDEVNIYKTDPMVADSDKDGYVDGAEILGGFDPLDDSLDSLIEYEDPKEAGVLEEGFFSISKIEIEEINDTVEGRINALRFEGKSLPNSFVTLYIFSIPTVVTVRTDDEGNWDYTLDKELEDGEHEIYVAMTDNSGKILAKSSPIPFVKEAAAVTVDQRLLSFQPEGISPGFFNVGYLYITILLLVIVMGVTLVFIGIRSRKVSEENNNLM